jgi:phosphoribosylanthranilate isomerase
MNLFGPGDPVRVKICGITNAVDAEMAIAAGADALGFNFYAGSKRRILFEESRDWISALEGRAFRVAVVVNSDRSELDALRDSECFEAVQFHGDETPELCAGAGFPVWIRAVRVRDRESLHEALEYDTRYLLLDGWSENSYGSTGARLDWDLVHEFIVAQPARQVILAGGLGPENVRQAIQIARPHAVDAASGVESSPGRKSRMLVTDFIRRARAA